jgi:hypothetical protein
MSQASFDRAHHGHGELNWRQALPILPDPAMMLTRLMIVASVCLGLFLLDRLSGVLLNFWLLESMGYASVFHTNFWMQAQLFVIGTGAFLLAVAAPAFLHGASARVKATMIWIGAFAGLINGYLLAIEYLEFLLPTAGQEFGRADPIFGVDASFYVFELEQRIYIWETALIVAVAGLLASVVTALLAPASQARPAGTPAVTWWLARCGTAYTMVATAAVGIAGAYLIWLGRYQLMFMENFEDSTEGGAGRGPEYVDVVGFFSTKNALLVESLSLLAIAVGLVVLMIRARRAVAGTASGGPAATVGVTALIAVVLAPIGVDLTFRAGVAARDRLFVIPNEPLIQLPYVQHHIDATNFAFDLDKIEDRVFVPRTGDDPLPDLATVLEDPAIQNAPLWPGSVLRYGRRITPQYVLRILQAEGDMTVYAPSLEILNAQEALRPYYGFLDVDTIGVPVNGEPTMIATAVRELPQDIVRPWLQAWGQTAFVLTHGHGLVAMHSKDATAAGDPVYLSNGLPSQATVPALALERNAVYYGEAATEAAFSNAVGLGEHDVSSEVGAEPFVFPPDVQAGIVMDGVLKRMVIGYETGAFLDVLFSGLIGDGTRAHVMRRPLERVQAIAPFLLVDLDPYAIPAEGGITWMVNTMTASQYYPYSSQEFLGNWSDLRTEMRPMQEVNYVRDAVKASIDAMTGQVTLYKFADEPVINTWAEVYPELFKPASEMPAEVRLNVQYPQEMMNIQFNKVYPYYHQRDALTFYASEDLLDDADEVVGPIRGQSQAITFTQSLFSWMATPGGAMPESVEDVQFVLTKTYTPQDPLNLRAIAMAYQYGADYGKLAVLKLPKGMFFLGPEQADALIDQDSHIAQQIGLWNRLGVEVIRGRTVNLIVEGELIYAEPIFIRSRQNPVPQLQRVVVVLRGKAFMGRTIEDALTLAYGGDTVAAGAVEPTSIRN